MAGKSIADNLQEVRDSIARACEKASRSSDAVRLLAVSKTKPLAMIREAYSAGQKSFGENYVQEAVEKAAAMPEADWHFIGSLQTNKARQVVGRFSLVHSVDRARLAVELGKAAEKAGVIQDVLVQIHIGEEASKHGVTIESAPELIHQILEQKSLRLRGLMSLPPLTNDENVGRGYFADLFRAFETWKTRELGAAAREFTELSIGTSSDYEWAIQEGATMVRIGTAIFGARET